MTDCEKRNINCPPKYKNIGSENFGDGKKVTADLLYQFCKNDSYLYQQVKDLWDKTDPETRKRFYPPYYMDTSKSYGVEPLVFDGSEVTDDDLQDKVSDEDLLKLKKPNGTIQNAYHLSNTLQEKYIVDFDYTNDKTYWSVNSNRSYDTLVIENDKIIDDASTLRVVSEDYGTADNPNIVHTVLPEVTTDQVSNKIPYVTTKYDHYTEKVTKKYTKAEREKLQKQINKEYKKLNKNRKDTKKVDVFGKLTLDAKCSGPYKNWNANSVWYIGYNRHKNYNVKNAWKKDPYNEDKASTKKHGRIPSICRAQTFKALHTGELRKVTFKMKGSNKSVSPCVVEIRTVDKKGKPTQEILARTEQKFNHTTASMVNFTFKKPCMVKKGTQYAIVLRSPLSNFNHCYWIVGWASTCFSNSKKRAYYDGETFLSEDNGKTWIVHGTREKCYGSHYYDWGFAEAPVNFGFEVYVAPKTGTKTIKGKGKLKVPEAPKTYDVFEDRVKEIPTTNYYDASVTLNYYKAGNYYLEFKPFVGNFYTSIQCIYDILNRDDSDDSYIGEYSWEIFNNDDKEWQSFEDFAETDLCNNSSNNPFKDPVSQESLRNYELVFNKALTFVKVRLKLTLKENVLVGNFDAELESQLAKIQSLNDSDASDDEITVVNPEDIEPWLSNIYSQFAWQGQSYTQGETHKPLGLRRLHTVTFNLFKKPSFKGYLRSLEYHPVQEGMLPACIWSEVDIDAIPKGDGDVKIDIVHEKTAIDHILFYKITNTELRQYIVEFEELNGREVGKDEYVISELVQEYILKGSTNNNYESIEDLQINEEFVDWLKEQSPRVYLLPFETKIVETDKETGEPLYKTNDTNTELVLDENNNPIPLDYKDVFFFGDWDNAPVKIDHYPSYPINSCNIGTDNVDLKLSESVNTSLVKADTANYICYEHNENLEGDVAQVSIQYKFATTESNEESDDGEANEKSMGTLELNEIELNKNTGEPVVTDGKTVGDYYIKDNKVYFNITPKANNEETYEHQLSQFIYLNGDELALHPCLDTEDVPENTVINYVEDIHLVIERKGYDYIEFQDYIVDYENRVFNFYNPWALSEGDLKINYNPLWVRNLSVNDFPLRMDLWTEYYQVRTAYDQDTNTEEILFDKCLINDCGDLIVDEASKGDSKPYILTSVPPLDNIRRIELQDINGNMLTDEAFVEDEDYYVDYLQNKITITYPSIDEGQVVMVKYTPNLTDNGLSIAYRMSRPLYDINDVPITSEQGRYIVDLTSKVHNELDDRGDDVYVMSNYFTTRT